MIDRRRFFQYSAVLLGSTVLPMGCGSGGGDGDTAPISQDEGPEIINLAKRRFEAQLDDPAEVDTETGELPSRIFSVQHDSYGVIDLELTQVDDEIFDPETEQFSIVLAGPKASPFETGTYSVYNASIGDFDLYIDPSSEESDQQLYIAHFSLLHSMAPQAMLKTKTLVV